MISKIFALCMLAIPLKSFAWGMIGHRVVGQIASNHLSAKAAKEVKSLLGDETLAMSTNWPDFVRSDPNYEKASPWHYVNLPDGKTYAEITKNPKGDVVEAIDRMTKTLADKKASKEARVEALKFLAHFVGDIHQPLHAGKSEDRGGNSVKVTWMDKESNLHRVWDEDLIKMQELSYSEYAAHLDHVTTTELKTWQSQDINVWIKEDMDLMPLVYDIGDGKLSYDYNFKTIKALEKRLLMGGVRLAGILNQTLK